MTFTTSASKCPFPNILGYTIVEQLYLGSRTAVYRATQDALQRSVVVKVMRREYPSMTDLMQFRNQYAIAKKLTIPGIVQPICLESLGSGYALVLEDCGGVSLRKYAQQRALSVEDVLAIAVQLADILYGLYQHRVVHKDLKPANILIHPESKQIHLIDFSIASLLPKETQEFQSVNGLEGTLAYLAPEQTGRMNRGVDYRTDFYALGVTLYELLSGTLPFEAEEPLELMHCHMAKSPVPVDQVNPSVPGMVAEIVARLMAKNAEDRYQSALGLKHDLMCCLQDWQSTGTVAEFVLGQQDVSDRFLIPDKLYGRDEEVQVLLDAFERVTQGHAELVLVAGYSGIGKTTVVNEVHKPIVRQRGYFIKGKFDQFNRNIPFSAFVQALRDLMEQLLTESDAQLTIWKTQILTALGDQAQVIVDVIPELEKIIGAQSAAPELSGTAAQKRFNTVFQKFIQVFTRREHPLVIFLDDLQWADSSSLKLIELLVGQSSMGHLLLIGAYRDNEVSPGHPLMLSLEEIEKTEAIIQSLAIAPLPRTSLNQLVADALHSSTDWAAPLTDLVEQKTQGNPFFARQFLNALHDEGRLHFDEVLGHWRYDLEELQANLLTDDVVELVSQQLQKLPATTQTVLKLAACVGNQFELQTLAIVAERSPVATANALWPALQMGLVLPAGQSYQYFQGMDVEPVRSDGDPPIDQSPHLTYRFAHDRIQQAAYTLIPEDQRQVTHLAIGQLLVKNQTDLDSNLFEIVNHWNTALALITDDAEKAQLAALNGKAGIKARISVAYEPALKYFKTGISLLAPDCWQTQYDLALTLYQGGIKTAFLSGDYEQMEQWAARVLHHAHTLLPKIQVYDIQIQAQMAQGKPAVAIAIALTALQLLDITFPESPTPADIDTALAETRALWSHQDVASLAHLPVMTDPEKIAAIVILSSIFAPSFIAKPEILPLIACQQVQLSIRHGNYEHSAFGYSNYSAILNALCHDLDASYAFGQLAIRLVDQLHATEVKARTFNQAAIFSMHGKVHLREALPILQDGCRSGIDSGDLEFAGYAAYNWSQYAYFSGINLQELQQGAQTYTAVLSQINQKISLRYNQLVHQVALNLMGDATDPCRLMGTEFDEVAALNEFLENQVFSGIQYLFTHKLALRCFFGNFDQLATDIDWAQRYVDASTGMIMVPEFHFFSGLASLQAWSMQPPDAQAQAIIEQSLAAMEQWATQAPMNFQHKLDLLEAERLRVLGNPYEAGDRYDHAIAGAKTHGYLQEEALANELAARFYLAWGKEKIAQAYLTDAYYGYAHWGATAKVQDLEARYSDLLAPLLQSQRSVLSATETVVASAPFQRTTTQASTTGSSGPDALDLNTVLKASQALSKEIRLDRLLTTLLDTVLENAGADKGALLMPQEEIWFVEAIATIDQPPQLQAMPLETSTDVPQGVINTVKHGLEPSVIVDATAHPTLATDAYVMAQQPKSMLCIPILQQGKLVAILYLENRVTVGAFTRDRIELLNLLCTQAAISLENARLYQQAQTDAQQLQCSLEQLRASEARFQKLANNVPGLIYQIRIEPTGAATVPYVSSGCQALYEVPPEDLISGKSSLRDFEHPDDREGVFQAVAQSAQTLTPFLHEWRIITPSGTVKWVKAASQPEREEDGTTVWDGILLDITERKQIEAEQVRLLAILESTSDFVGTVDPAGNILYLNRAWRSLLSLTDDVDLAASNLAQHYPAWALSVITNQAFPAATKSGFWLGETAVLDNQGQEIPVSQAVIAHKDSQGQVEYFSTILRDISEIKAAEAALRASERNLRTIFDSSTSAIFIHDLDGKILDVNNRMLELYRVASREEAIALEALDYSAPDNPFDQVPLMWERVVAGETVSVEWKCQRPGDRVAFDGEIILSKIMLDSQEVIVASIQDISERQAALRERNRAEAAVIRKSKELAQALQEVQRKEAQSRGIFEAVSDGLLVTDLETGKVLDANPAYYQLHGYSYDEILQLHPLDFIPPSHHHKFDAFVSTVKSGREFSCEAVCKKQDGTLFYIEIKAVPFSFDGQRCALSVIRDVTERKYMELSIHEKNRTLEQAMTELQQAQTQIVQSEKMSALGNLVAGVAHEINNPVGFLNGSIHNAKDYVKDLLEHLAQYQQCYPTPEDSIQDHAEDIDLEFLGEDLPKLLGSMEGALDRIKSISTSLRTFSRADTEYKVNANLHEGIDSTLLILKYRLKANERRPVIQVEQHYGALPEIECFPGQLNQVFMNILANAIDMFDEAAQGVAFAELEENPQVITVQTRVLTEDAAVEIRIRDNGVGMPEDVRQRVFDHLFTTKGVGKGTGLGLAIARQIVVDNHGGSLEVWSELGQGSEFCIRLPMQA